MRLLELITTAVLFATRAQANWAWVGGTQATNAQPSDLGLFVEAPSVTPGALSAMGYLTNDSYIFTFGGISSNSGVNNYIWRYNHRSGMWSPMFLSVSPVAVFGIKGVFYLGVVPAPIQSPMVFLDNKMNSLFVFSGIVTSEIYDNNMFEFNLDLNLWRWIHGPGVAGDFLGSYGQLGVESPFNVPSARHSQAYFYDQLTRRAHIYGGFTEKNGMRFLADHWRYSVPNNTWTWIHGVSEVDSTGVYGVKGVGTAQTRPGSRGAASYTFDAIYRRFYMFSGIGSTVSATPLGVPTDLWYYEPDRNIWTWLTGDVNPQINQNYGTRGVTEPGRFPRSRTYSPMVIDHKSHKLYLFSGYLSIDQEAKTMNDLWSFDLELLMWTWLAGSSSYNAPGRYGQLGVASPSNNPPARHGPIMSLYNSTLYMFGGDTSDTDRRFSDMWAYFIDSRNLSSISSILTSRTTTSSRISIGESGTLNQVSTVISVAVSVVAVLALTFFLALIIRRKNGKQARMVHLLYDQKADAAMAETGTATLAPTSVGLSLPGHLLVRETDFRFGELLTSGGCGDVYRGDAISLSLMKRCRELVIKRLTITNKKSFKLFEQEVSIMYLLAASQFVAKIVGFSTEPPVLLMKLYKDGSLTSFATKHPPNRKWRLRFSLNIARGLRDIHKAEIAHCDMKPQNVLIDRDDNGKPLCVITDFGIAQVLSERLLVVKYSQAVSIRGLSIQYAAPEVFLRFRNKFENNTPVMLKSGDVYALGMIFKFLLTCKEPWD